MQVCLAVTVVVFIILEVTSRSVSGKCEVGKCEVDKIIAENSLTANDLNVYNAKISQSSYQAVFNIDGDNKTMTAGSTHLILITNETEHKWTTFSYSEALFRFVIGNPIKVMMYQEGKYQEQYLGNKRISIAACQDIDCKPYISLPANSYFKTESFQKQDCEQYVLYSVTLVPSMEQLQAETVDDDKLPFKNMN